MSLNLTIKAINFLKLIVILLAQFAIAVVSIFTVQYFSKHFIHIGVKKDLMIVVTNNTTNMDSLALVNTFMVFVTVIVVIATIIITIVGILYTNWFARQKELILRENIDELIEIIEKKDDIKDKILDKLFKRKKIETILNDSLKKQHEEYKKFIDVKIKDIEEKLYTIKENTKQENIRDKNLKKTMDARKQG